jgi:hypothetical protein
MKLQPMTINLLSVLKEDGIMRISRNRDRKAVSHLDKVIEDLKTLAKSNEVRLYESNAEPYEIIVTTNDQRFNRSFII